MQEVPGSSPGASTKESSRPQLLTAQWENAAGSRVLRQTPERAIIPPLDCPDQSALAEYYLASVADARVNIDKHVAGCRRCRAQLALLKAAHAPALPSLQRKREGHLARWWFNPWTGMAVASALAIITTLGMGRELFAAKGRSALPTSTSATERLQLKPDSAIATLSAEPWVRAIATTPDGRVRWEAGIGGRVERLAGPARVQWIPSGIASDLLAISAASGAVCWIAGRDGVVIRTTDGGAHWKQLGPPTTADLTAIVARNDRDAAVVTAEGRRYATADGGLSWQVR